MEIFVSVFQHTIRSIDHITNGIFLLAYGERER